MEMNERELTDEETIQVLDECFAKVGVMSCEGCKVYSGNGLRACMKHIGRLALDFIYRLQDEKQKVIQDYYAEKQTCDEQKDIIAKQKAEIGQLKLELSAAYEDRVDICKKLAEQKAEIERLTENRNGWRNRAWKDEKEKAELQKQVDHYKEKWQTAYTNELNLQKQVDELKEKFPNNCVVLSKEEWDKLMGDTYTSKEVDEIVAYKERVKAREVAQNILTRLADDFDVAGMDVEYPLNRVKVYAKECGVEVE